MAFFIKGDKFSYLVANATIKQLGLSLTSAMDDKEIRIKLEGGKYRLKINDSGVEKVVGDVLASETILRSTATDVSADTEWQDGKKVILGTDADTQLVHTGTDFYFDNYTGNMILRQINNQKDFVVKGKDSSGTLIDMLEISARNVPPFLRSAGAILSKMGSTSLSNNGIHDTKISINSVGFFIFKHGTDNNLKNGAIYLTGGKKSIANGIELLHGDNTYYGDLKDQMSINVYGGTSTVEIQNISGFSVSFSYGFLGIFV